MTSGFASLLPLKRAFFLNTGSSRVGSLFPPVGVPIPITRTYRSVLCQTDMRESETQVCGKRRSNPSDSTPQSFMSHLSLPSSQPSRWMDVQPPASSQASQTIYLPGCDRRLVRGGGAEAWGPQGRIRVFFWFSDASFTSRRVFFPPICISANASYEHSFSEFICVPNLDKNERNLDRDSFPPSEPPLVTLNPQWEVAANHLFAAQTGLNSANFASPSKYATYHLFPAITSLGFAWTSQLPLAERGWFN